MKNVYGASLGVGILVTTHAMGHEHSRVLHLVRSSLATKLKHSLRDLSHSRCAYGMSTGQQTARWVHGYLTAETGCPRLHETAAFTFGTQAHGLVVKYLGNGEGVMTFYRVEVFGRESGLLIGLPAAPIVSLPRDQIHWILVAACDQDGCSYSNWMGGVATGYFRGT
jgi:hypothetical protein